MKELSPIGFQFIIISNQAGINRGIIKKNKFQVIKKNLNDYFKKNKINVIDSFYCPHHWVENYDCRKPNNGLFITASKKYSFRLDQVIYIGDHITDYQAALNSNCFSIIIASNTNNQNYKNKLNLLLKTSSQKKAMKEIKKFYK